MKEENFLDLSLALPPYHSLKLHVQGLYLPYLNSRQYSPTRSPVMIITKEGFPHLDMARLGEFLSTRVCEHNHVMYKRIKGVDF